MIFVFRPANTKSANSSSFWGVGNERKYRLIDVDGKEITPSELAEKYFSSPEDGFIKDDETLKAERVASISNNHLYSQSIQHKITPLACNNILTKSYNNDIEDFCMQMVLEGGGDGINKKDDSQIAKQDMEGIIKPENSPSCSAKAPPSSPQFECPFQGCRQRLSTKSELIAHMDKEAADARQDIYGSD